MTASSIIIFSRILLEQWWHSSRENLLTFLLSQNCLTILTVISMASYRLANIRSSRWMIDRASSRFFSYFSLEYFFSRVSLEVFMEILSFFCRLLASILLFIEAAADFFDFFIDFFLLLLLYRLAKLSMLNDIIIMEFLSWIYEHDLRLIDDSSFRRNKRAS